jgi:hypothetical protein
VALELKKKTQLAPVEIPPAPEPAGFRARLDGITLWDLVQLECLSGGRKAVRVQSALGRAHLFFEDGQLVHAQHGTLVGDAAALAVLQWTRGEVTPCELPWPRSRSVATPWQSLLMQAAQREDERRHAQRLGSDGEGPGRKSGVLRLGAVSIVDAPQQPEDPIVEYDDGASDEDVELEIDWLDADAEEGGAAGHSAQDFPMLAHGRATRLDAEGEVVASVGDAEELSGQAAYTRRLADLIGEMLSLGGFRALELRAKDGPETSSTFVYGEDGGGTVALAPSRAEDAVRIRKHLEL